MDILLESFDETAISKVLLISCALTSQKLTYFTTKHSVDKRRDNLGCNVDIFFIESAYFSCH